MKLTLKDLVKLIAPYLVAIGGAIGVYADGTDAINDSLSAVSSRRVLSVPRWCCSRCRNSYSWFMSDRGHFGCYNFFYNSYRCCAVALLEYPVSPLGSSNVEAADVE